MVYRDYGEAPPCVHARLIVGVVDPGAFLYAIATPDFDVYVEVCDASNVGLAAFHLPGPNNGLPVGVPPGTIYGFAPTCQQTTTRV